MCTRWAASIATTSTTARCRIMFSIHSSRSSWFSSSTVSSSLAIHVGGPLKTPRARAAILTPNALNPISKTQLAFISWAPVHRLAFHVALNCLSTSRTARASETRPSGKSNNCETITIVAKKREIYLPYLKDQHRRERKRYITRCIECLIRRWWLQTRKNSLKSIQLCKNAMLKISKAAQPVSVQFKTSIPHFQCRGSLSCLTSWSSSISRRRGPKEQAVDKSKHAIRFINLQNIHRKDL